MKKLLLIALLFSASMIAQTTIQGNLLVQDNMTIGQNCGQMQTITYTGDCNFNGNYTLTLKGVNLIIQGNINGTGTVTSFCNNNIANICGTLQPNSGVTLTNITYCGSPLSIKTFDITKDDGYHYTIYDFTGKEITTGITNQDMLNELPNTFLLLVVDGFKPLKIYISN